jgi:hypothetical protein
VKLRKHGKNISELEVLNVSIHGVWLYFADREYFLPYESYPWFKNATIAKIHNVRLVRDKYLRWDELDVDLLIDSLNFPEKFPLIYLSCRKIPGL